MVVTMGDVAELAGVSQRTVSNVVRGYQHVRPETRARVQSAIDQLKYRPNVVAQSLRQGRTGILALAVPEIASPYFAELANHVQKAAAAHGQTLLIDQTGGDPVRELLVLDGYRAHVIDGLLFNPQTVTAEDVKGRNLSLPTVLLGERVAEADLAQVAMDNIAAAAEVTELLLADGRQRIAAVGADGAQRGSGPGAGRLTGWRLAHTRRGLEPGRDLEVAAGVWSRASGYAAVDALLACDTDVDALFCFNDVLALGALRALAEHGCRVPEDIAVVGWDDIEEAAYSTPSLTSVQPDKAGIAQTAVALLMSQISSSTDIPDDITCSHRIVERETTRRRRA